LKVNVTQGPVTVVLRVTVDAAVVSLYMTAVGPKPDYSIFAPCLTTAIVPVAGIFVCDISVTFPPFIVPGNYSLGLVVSTTNYFFIASSTELKNRTLPYAVEVVNTVLDTTPPQLLDLRARSSTTVDVTNGFASVDLLVVVQDDLSQLRYGYIRANGPEGFYTQADFRANEFPYNNSVAGRPMTFNTSFFLSFAPPGTYSLQVFLVDTAGNTIDINTDSLAQRSFLSSITIIDDVTPPVILKPIEISPTSVNVTFRPATIDIKLLVQDDISGVQSVYASLYNPASPEEVFQQLSAYYAALVPVAGKAVPISMSLVVPRYTRSGRYVLSLEVSDARGNTLSYNFDGANKTSLVDIFNALEDVSPPKLLSLIALTPANVNASSTSRSVRYEVVAQDVVSGIKEVYLSASNSDGSSYINDPIFPGYQKTPIAGQPAKFNISLEVKQSTKPGKYLLRLELSDAAGNYITFTAEQLAAKNVTSSIEVVNPEYDGQPPELKDLTLLSSSKVNVSLTPAMIDLQLLVLDDISGFKYGTVELYNSEGSVVSNATFTASKKVLGKATAYNVSLTIPKFVMPSAYPLNINLFDFADNVAYFYSSRLSDLSFPSEIEVSNTVVDSEPPVLVSFTTRSPLVVDVTSGPVTVEFQAVALDALSGVQYGYAAISCPDFYDTTEVKFDKPIVGRPVAFNISFILEPALSAGVCSLELAFQDAAVQYISLSSTDLISRGLIGNLTIA
jgi:hypothetical protein